MKKILIILLAFIPFLSYSQVDSTTVKVTASIRASDCEYVANAIQFNAGTEYLFDGMKAKFRVASPPSGNTLVQLDTIPIGDWLVLSKMLRRDAISQLSGTAGRINTALTNLNVPFLTNRLNDLDNDAQNIFQDARIAGRKILRKQ